MANDYTPAIPSRYEVNGLQYMRDSDHPGLLVIKKGEAIVQLVEVTWLQNTHLQGFNNETFLVIAEKIHALFAQTLGETNMKAGKDWGIFRGKVSQDLTRVMAGEYTGSLVIKNRDRLTFYLDEIWTLLRGEPTPPQGNTEALRRIDPTPTQAELVEAAVKAETVDLSVESKVAKKSFPLVHKKYAEVGLSEEERSRKRWKQLSEAFQNISEAWKGFDKMIEESKGAKKQVDASTTSESERTPVVGG